MAFTLLAHTAKGSTPDPAIVTSDPIDTTGAKLISVEVGQFRVIAIHGPSDSYGNVWTPRFAYGTSYVIQAWECINPKCGPGHTFTVDGGTFFIYPAVSVSAWSATNPIFDAQNGTATAASTTIQPGSVTPAGPNELFITAALSNQAGHPVSINSGFTVLDTVTPNLGESVGFGHAYLIQGSAAAENPTWTGTDQGGAVLLCYRENIPAGPLVTLSLASGVGNKGGSIALNLSITSTGGATCAFVGWTFSYTTDVTLASVALGSAGTGASKTLGRVGNVCTVGGNTNIIGNGVLATATFNIAANPSAPIITISMTSLTARDSSGNSIATLEIPGNITFSLPPGLTLAPDGTISGIPTTPGTYTYTAQVTDSSSPANTATVTCTIVIGTATPCEQFSPPHPQTDAFFELRRVYCTMKPQPHIKVRGS